MSLEVRVPSPKADVLKVLPASDCELVLERDLRRSLPRGAFLVRQGEQAETLFFVLSGRFDVLRGGTDLIAEIGEGEPIGEIAFFGELERTADIVAARCRSARAVARGLRGGEDPRARLHRGDPALLRAEAAGRRGLGADPQTATGRDQCASGRGAAGARAGRDARDRRGPFADRRGDRPARHRRSPRDCAGPGRPLCPLADGAGGGAGCPSSRHRRRRRVFRPRGAGGQRPSRPMRAALAGPERARCLERGREPDSLASFLPRKLSLVLYRDKGDASISGTRHWLEGRPAHLHHHLALDSDGDVRRLSRFLAGKAVGMVFGGGGALGAAHIGVMRALHEAGLVFDFFGSTSIGASIAMEYASGRDPAGFGPQFQAFFTKYRALGRLTVPLYSVFDHTHFDAELARRYGDAALEDYPIGAFAVSTSLTRGQSVVHRSGSAWAAVRASASIPGALPPFVTETGEVLVDGGLLDNVPLDVVHSLKAGPNVAVALSAGSLWTVAHPYGKPPNRGSLVRELALRRHRAGDFPRITEVVARSMKVTSDRSQIAMDLAGDLLIEPPSVPGMTILDWAKTPAQIEAGYRYTQTRIEKAGSVEALLRSARGG